MRGITLFMLLAALSRRLTDYRCRPSREDGGPTREERASRAPGSGEVIQALVERGWTPKAGPTSGPSTRTTRARSRCTPTARREAARAKFTASGVRFDYFSDTATLAPVLMQGFAHASRWARSCRRIDRPARGLHDDVVLGLVVVETSTS
jgi:hypothetical protein